MLTVLESRKGHAIRKTVASGAIAFKGIVMQFFKIGCIGGGMKDYLAKVTKDIREGKNRDDAGTYLKKIEGDNWYNSRFVQLCIIFFFLVGLFSGLTVGGA
jgi:hypothetical protein